MLALVAISPGQAPFLTGAQQENPIGNESVTEFFEKIGKVSLTTLNLSDYSIMPTAQMITLLEENHSITEIHFSHSSQLTNVSFSLANFERRNKGTALSTNLQFLNPHSSKSARNV